MSKYGVVVNSSKDYVEFHGCRIENERRNVLFTAIFNRSALIGGELRLFDTTVFAKVPYLDQEIALATGLTTGSTLEAFVSAGGSTNSAESSGAMAALDASIGGGGGNVGFDSSTIRSAAQAFQRKLHTSQQRQKERHLGAREKTTAHHRMSYQPQPVSYISTIIDHSDPMPGPLPTTAHKISPPHPAPQPLQHLLVEGLTITEPSGKVIKATGGGGSGSDARQLQKRSEAFEQLSQFLQ